MELTGMELTRTQIKQINRRIKINRRATAVVMIVILHILVGIPLAPLLLFVDHSISLPIALAIYLVLLGWIATRLRGEFLPDVSSLEIVTLEARFCFTVRYFYRHHEKSYTFKPYSIDAANNPGRWFQSKQPLKLHTPYRVKAIRIPWPDTREETYYLLEETFEEIPAYALATAHT